MMTRNLKTAAILVAVMAVAVQTADADTVGYWRFESGSLLADSSGNGHALTAINSPVAYALPASGQGSEFPSPIPQTGASEGQAASVGNMDGYYVNGGSDFTFGEAMTVEGFFNYTSGTTSGSKYVVSQWNANTDQADSWGVGVNGGRMRVVFGVGDAGISAHLLFNSGTIVDGHDYYFAMTFDAGTVTGYIQDLTAGTALMTDTTTASISEIQHVNTQITLGGLTGASGQGITDGANIIGVFDEIRISNAVLGTDDLLITAVPEPATMGLLALGAVGLMRRRRR